jgi:hypothetical protein
MDSRKDVTKCWLYYLSYGPSIASISSSLIIFVRVHNSNMENPEPNK